MFSINSIASGIWKKLEENPKGMTLCDIANYVEQACKQSSGNEVTRWEMERDIDELLDQLQRRGVVQKKTRRQSNAVYKITSGVVRTEDEPSIPKLDRPVRRTRISNDNDEMLRSVKLLLTPASLDPTLEITVLDQIEQINTYSSKIHTVIAFVAFAAYDIVLKLLDFNKLCRIVEHGFPRKRKKPKVLHILRVCAGIERARIWYPKQIMCMQHSTIIRCLLRYHGVLAEIVFAGRRMPFQSHAWVEVDGIVVNDTQRVQSFYRVFKRF